MYTTRIIRLIFGISLFSLGLVLTVNGNLGLAPWEALHIGLSKTLGFTFGQVSMIVGLIVILITYQLRESIGIGTIANIFIIGILVDMIFNLGIIPISDNIGTGTLMLLVGMVFIALGSYFYIGSGFGAGPRDGLMVCLTRVTQKPIGLIRGLIELTVLFLGYLLGAKVGVGTLILCFGIGPIVQFTFKIFNFDVTSVNHDAIIQKSA